jgi:hypothetical protein
MTETAPACSAVDDHMSDIIDGVAPDALFDHVAGCERCRDARFAAEQVIAELGQVAADYRFPEQLEARLMAALDEQATGATGATGAAAQLPTVTLSNAWRPARGGVRCCRSNAPLAARVGSRPAPRRGQPRRGPLRATARRWRRATGCWRAAGSRPMASRAPA